ncbi:unnamed protein product [Schistosoma margrebowiei]|uniref:Uncharacterized protein n=1 Tax=Schistosoma margrebowiei TaxID=48269 RepID=A0AA85ALF5_9TREM|nr:unnamed protein product [Schistosoma margrebowiei]
MSELNLSKWMSEFHAKLQGILSYTRLVRRCILLISVDISSTHHKKRMDTYLMPLLFCINIYTVFYNVLKVLFDRALGNDLTRSDVEELNDAERGIVMFRENEKLIITQMNNMAQNLFPKSEAIKEYVKCISEQHQAESYYSFIKEMSEQFENKDLISFTHYSTLKNCFMKQKQISERQKFNNKNKVCKILETFTEKDIQVLNRLISNKYDILWRWNKILFNYDFASRNIKQTMVFLRKLYDHFDVILSENVHHNY